MELSGLQKDFEEMMLNNQKFCRHIVWVYDAHDLLRISFFKMRLANYSLVANSGPSPTCFCTAVS